MRLQENSGRLSRRGLDADFVSQYSADLEQVQSLDNEQEQLKARLNAKTSELNDKLASLEARYSEARKIVKIEMDPAAWKQFGIQDKR